jgi:hypothetical protein
MKTHYFLPTFITAILLLPVMLVCNTPDMLIQENKGKQISSPSYSWPDLITKSSLNAPLPIGIYIAGYLDEPCPTVDAGPDITTCEGGTYNLADAAAIDYNGLQWTTNGDGFFDDENSINTDYYPGLGDYANGVVELCLTAYPIYPCMDYETDCMVLSFQAAPIANAGGNATINVWETYAPNASAGNYSAILWETDGDGSFDSYNILTPVYTLGVQDKANGGVLLTIMAYGIYPCTGFDVDELWLEIVYSEPVVEITLPAEGATFNSNPILVEGTASDADGDLDYVEVSVNSGMWQRAIGTENWSIEVQLVACLNYIEARAVDLQGLMTMTDIVWDVQLMPFVDAGADATTGCLEGVQLNGVAENYTSSHWYTTNGTGIILLENELTAAYIPSQQDEITGDIEICLIAYGVDPCEDAEDCMILTVTSGLTVYAGADATINCDDFYFIEDALAYNYSGVEWSTNGDGFFEDATLQNPGYIPGPGDCANCSVELCVTAYPNDPCTVSATDCMILHFGTEPLSTAPLGSGTAGDPYLIENLENLYWITLQTNAGNTFSGKFFLQTAGIDASETQSWFCGLGWIPIGTVSNPFSGSYDGRCNTIESLYINRPNESYLGLFGVTDEAEIKKLRLLNFNILGNKLVGALAGRITNATSVSYVNAESVQIYISDNYGGGLVGQAILSSIYRCSSSGQLSKGGTNNWNWIGGLIGAISEATLVEECYSTTNVTSSVHNIYAGLVGAIWFDSEIMNCYARGAVVGTWAIAGGLVGDFDIGSITNCYSTGLVNAPLLVGGFVGRKYPTATYSNNFWDINTSNQSTSVCATGKTTAEMKTPSTFTDAAWDFDNIWDMDGSTNDGYPVFKWQLAPVVFAGDDDAISSGSIYYLNGIADNYSSLLWTSSGDGSFSNPEILYPEYSLGEMDVANGQVILCLTAYPLDPCMDPVTDCMNLFFQLAPTANAGDDETICQGSEYQLDGLANFVSSVMWSGGLGSFVSPESLNAIYIPRDDETGEVELTLTGYAIFPSTGEVTDAMVLTIQGKPFVKAGEDMTFCDTEETFDLAGTASSYSFIEWSGGNGYFDDTNILDAVYSADPQDIIDGTITLCLTATPLPPCEGIIQDCITITFDPSPVISNLQNATICEGSTLAVNAVVSNYSSVLWTTSGNGTFEPPTSPNTIYTPDPSEYGEDVWLCIEALPTGVCQDNVNDCLDLFIQLKPTVDAGSDDTLTCEMDMYELNGFAENCSQLQWYTTNGTGSFSSPNEFYSHYYRGPQDQSIGDVEICLKATGIDSCDDVVVTDCLTLYFYPLPEVICPNDFSVCIDQSGIWLSGATPAGGIYSGPYVYDNIIFSTEFAGVGAHTITYTYTDEHGCTGSCTFNITVVQKPSAYAGGDAEVCEGNSYKLLEATAANYSQLLWVSYGTGYFDDPTILNPVYYPSSIDLLLGSVELCLNAAPLNPCSSGVTDCMTLTILTMVDLDFGDAPDSPVISGYDYKTLLINEGARHHIVEGVYLGYSITSEPDGLPSWDANLDDDDGILFNYSNDPILNVGINYISVKASVAGYLDAWIDLDNDGNWEGDSKHVLESFQLDEGYNEIEFIELPFTAEGKTGYARFRFRTSSNPISYKGFVENGEVEDYWVAVQPPINEYYDYGDAPDNPPRYNYATLQAHGGARHKIVPGEEVYLGNGVSIDPDGKPGMYADYDEFDDGIIFNGGTIPELFAGNNTLTVEASVGGFLDAWIDFNADETWVGSGEHVLTAVPLSLGPNTINNLFVPSDAIGPTFARFRFRTFSEPVDFYGMCWDGEVEDYLVCMPNALPVIIPDVTICNRDEWNCIPMKYDNELCDVTRVRWSYSINNGSSWIKYRCTQGISSFCFSPKNIYIPSGETQFLIKADLNLSCFPCPPTIASGIGVVYLCEERNYTIQTVNPSPPGGFCGIADPPFPLVLNPDPDCPVEYIKWYDRNGIVVASGVTVYQPPTLYYNYEGNSCHLDYEYTVKIKDVCGEKTASHTIRVYNSDPPKGILEMAPQETEPLCYDEDITLSYTPECTDDPPVWHWFYRNESMQNYEPIPNAGTQNTHINTNKLKETTWYMVEKENVVCLPEYVELEVKVKELFEITAFNVSTDPCSGNSSMIYIEFEPSPTNQGQVCVYELKVYKDGLLSSEHEVTESPVYIYTPSQAGGVPGNYYVTLQDLACPQIVTTEVVTIYPSCVPVISGPCYRCFDDTSPIVLSVSMLLPPDKPCPYAYNCTYQWYFVFDGIQLSIPGAVNPVYVSANAGDFMVRTTCNTLYGECIKDAFITVVQCPEPCPPGKYLAENTVTPKTGEMQYTELPALQPKPLWGSDFFNVYPNPTDGTFTLEMKYLLDETDNSRIQIEIYDMIGQIVYRGQLPAQKQHILSLEKQLNGLYMIRVVYGDRTGSGKIIKR